MPTNEITQLRSLGLPPTSLDAPIGDADDNRFGDIIEDETALPSHELLRISTLRDDICQHIKQLVPREAAILTLRYGIDGRGSRTLEAISKRFNVTRERIRQLQKSALTKLRCRLNSVTGCDLE